MSISLDNLKEIKRIKKYHKENILLGSKHKKNNEYEKKEYNTISDEYPYNTKLYKNFTAENLLKSLESRLYMNKFLYCEELKKEISDFCVSFTKIIERLKKEGKLY